MALSLPFIMVRRDRVYIHMYYIVFHQFRGPIALYCLGMVQHSGGMSSVLQSLWVLRSTVLSVLVTMGVVLSHIGPVRSMSDPIEDMPSLAH